MTLMQLTSSAFHYIIIAASNNYRPTHFISIWPVYHLWTIPIMCGSDRVIQMVLALIANARFVRKFGEPLFSLRNMSWGDLVLFLRGTKTCANAWTSSQHNMYVGGWRENCPKKAGIGSSTPATLVGRRATDDGWMGLFSCWARSAVELNAWVEFSFICYFARLSTGRIGRNGALAALWDGSRLVSTNLSGIRP